MKYYFVNNNILKKQINVEFVHSNELLYLKNKELWEKVGRLLFGFISNEISINI
jgi:hypothetical protein